MSLVEEILKELWDTSIHSKGGTVNLFGIPKFKKVPSGSLRTTIYRLKKENLIEKQPAGWFLTPAGRKYTHKKLNSLQEFFMECERSAPKNLLIMFDIPEPKKAEREWFRWHLKKFNFVMVQRSVWVGPSPLPKDFLTYIRRIGLKDSVKTFKLAKPYRTRSMSVT